MAHRGIWYNNQDYEFFYVERVVGMQVKLLAYTPEPEKTVACAAKLCYAAANIDTE